MITIGHQRVRRQRSWKLLAGVGAAIALLLWMLTLGAVVASLVLAPACAATSPRGAQPAVTGRVAPTPVSGHPVAVATAENDQSVFVALATLGTGDPNGIQVFRRGPDGLLPQGIIPLRSAVSGLVLTPDGQVLLATVEDGVAVLDVARGSTGDPSSLMGYVPAAGGAGAFGTALAAGRYLFRADRQAGRIDVLDLPRIESGDFGPSAQVGTIEVDVAPSGLAVSPDGRYVYVVSQLQRPAVRLGTADLLYGGLASLGALRKAGTLSVIDMKRIDLDPSTAVVARVSAGCAPTAVAASPDGKMVWVAARQSNELLAFAADRMQRGKQAGPVAQVPVGAAPIGLQLVRGGRFALVAASSGAGGSGAAQEVYVVDTVAAVAGRQAVRTRIPVGVFSGKISVSTDQRLAYVANIESSALTAVDLTALLG